MTIFDWLIENEDVMGEGPGLWCPLHIFLMFALAIWLVIIYFVFKKHKAFALKFTTVLCYVVLFFRIFRMTLLFVSGKQTFVEALPWQLCHLMAFIFPLFYLNKWKKGFFGVLALTFFGGIITFVFGDYYYLSTLSFLHYESLFLHFAMPTLVIGCIASNYFTLRFKDFWQAYVALGLFVCWSSLGNLLVKDGNFLYLQENGLPFTLFGLHFYFTYFVLIVVCSILFMLLMWLISRNNSKPKTSFDIIMNTLKNKDF